MNESVPISFPGLHLTFHVHQLAFSIGDYGIRWYGILIAAGLLLALLYGMKRAPEFKITQDDLSDVVIFSIILAIVGARLYYVVFYYEQYSTNPYWSDPLSILRIWEGGLGIYGGIVAAFLTAFVVCKIKKISTGAVFDIASLGFLIGQAIGRWGNFFNREAYGSVTSLPWRMVVDGSGEGYHPCFLYESLWCVLGFVILHKLSKHRKFNGETFLMYIMWYGFGRFFIEALRADSLRLGTMKVSMIVAALTFFTALSLYIYKRARVKDTLETAGYTSVYREALDAIEADEQRLDSEYGNDDADAAPGETDENAAEDVSASDESDAQDEPDAPSQTDDKRPD